MRLIVQKCSNKQNYVSYVAYVTKRLHYGNIEWNWVAVVFYAFYTTLLIKCKVV